MIKPDKALIKAFAEIQNPKLDGTNPHFRSKYATLESVLHTIKPVLLKHGLVVVQTPTMDENGVVTVETSIVSESCVLLSSSMSMKPKDNSPHAVGSCITYIRRYALMSIFGIVGEEDDDGNNAQGLKPTTSSLNTPVTAPKTDMSASEHIVHAALSNGWTKTDIIRAVSAKFKKGSLESLNAEEQKDLYKTVSTMTIEQVIAAKARA